MDYDTVPTVIFSEPECATVGYSEKEAREKFGTHHNHFHTFLSDSLGDDEIQIFTTKFTNSYYSPLEPERKHMTYMKMVLALR